MRDLFDDFMRELQERQAGRRGQSPGFPRPGSPEDPDPEGAAEPAEGGAGHDPSQTADADDGPTTAERPDSDEEAEVAEEPSPDEPGPDLEEPITIPPSRGPRRGARGGGGGRRLRRVRSGGPNDGGGPRITAGTVLLVLLGVLLLVLVLFAGAGVNFLTDLTWYRSVGYDGVFWTRVGTQLGLFFGGALVVLAVLGANIWLAGRFAPPPVEGGPNRLRELFERFGEATTSTELGRRRGPGRGGGLGAFDVFGHPPRRPGATDESEGTGSFGPARTVLGSPEMPDLTPIFRWVLVGVALLAALAIAGGLAGHWETLLLWQHRVTFAPPGAAPVTDPIFGRDIGFFLFELPVFRLGQATINGLILASLVVSIGRYLIAAARGAASFPSGARLHLGVLVGLYLISVAAGYQLDKFELAYSSNGVVAGVSYTDQAARFLSFDALTVIAALTAAFVIGGAFTRMLWPIGLGLAVWIGASVVLGTLYPEAIQRFTVTPNEYAQEQPYIQNNMAMTRLAYGLNQWDTSNYQGTAPLTADALSDDATTFQNARLWDYRPLGATLDQLQTVRQYYDFYDVDTDRYVIDDNERQVMLSAREMALDKNPLANTWVNSRIVFTHGYGLAMVPVNAVTSEGLPQLIVKDLPTVSSAGAPDVKEARIYFGERPSDYVLVGARQAEFDYPIGREEATGADTTTRWTGTTGISLGSTLDRLLFAIRFRDLNLLISDQITAQSQLLFHRSLGDRVNLIAPFLSFDKDPYLVVTQEGRLVYIQDAYTTSDRFPHAQPFDPSTLGEASGLRGSSFNYIRNSVKIVQDAYDGTLTFYAADPSDPILRAYEGVFPGLFKPLDEMPAELRAHLRYPEELFNVQTRTFARYHVTNPQSLYNNDDLWTVPALTNAQNQLPEEAYYVIMRMPGETAPEFLLLQPMVPAQRPNMIAWIAARNDGAAYGGVRVYQFPRDTSIYGPTQIEARIDQDPTISAQLTLWGQVGSTVIRGNLIVVPVQDSLIYLEPIYLQSTASAFPEFTKIVVATPTTIVWGDTLSEALQLVLAGGPSAHALAEPDARADAGTRCLTDAGALGRPGWYAGAHGRHGPRRLRQPPLRSRPAGAARRRFRPLRLRDRDREGHPAPAAARHGGQPFPGPVTRDLGDGATIEELGIAEPEFGDIRPVVGRDDRGHDRHDDDAPGSLGRRAGGVRGAGRDPGLRPADLGAAHADRRQRLHRGRCDHLGGPFGATHRVGRARADRRPRRGRGGRRGGSPRGRHARARSRG